MKKTVTTRVFKQKENLKSKAETVPETLTAATGAPNPPRPTQPSRRIVKAGGALDSPPSDDDDDDE